MVLSGIWQQLGIEATNDIKLIKKAYAKQLKRVRPDEKPEAFQQLHQSYKTALQQAKWNTQQSVQAKNNLDYNVNDVTITYGNDDAVIITDLSNNEQKIEETESPVLDIQPEIQLEAKPEPRPTEPATVPEQNDYQYEIARMMVKVESAISKDSRGKPESWQFVLGSEYILDSEYVYLFGFALFKRFAKYFNDKQYRKDGDYRITSGVLQYLDSIFHWSESEIIMPDYISDKYGLSIFERLERFKLNTDTTENALISGLRGAKSIKKVGAKDHTPLKSYYYGSGLKRIVAMIIDFIIVSPAMVLFRLFNENIINLNFFNYKYFDVSVFFVIYLIGTWLFETSRFRATPGKLVMGLRVISKEQEQLGYLHGLLRVCVFAITSLGFYLTIIINSWLSGNFIHDRISRSYVMDLSRSRKEQKRNK